jgi:hypothetical protein
VTEAPRVAELYCSGVAAPVRRKVSFVSSDPNGKAEMVRLSTNITAGRHRFCQSVIHLALSLMISVDSRMVGQCMGYL